MSLKHVGLIKGRLKEIHTEMKTQITTKTRNKLFIVTIAKSVATSKKNVGRS